MIWDENNVPILFQTLIILLSSASLLQDLLLFSNNTSLCSSFLLCLDGLPPYVVNILLVLRNVLLSTYFLTVPPMTTKCSSKTLQWP